VVVFCTKRKSFSSRALRVRVSARRRLLLVYSHNDAMKKKKTKKIDDDDDDDDDYFERTAARFRAFHSNGLNVALHLITTPSAIASTCAAVRFLLLEAAAAFPNDDDDDAFVVWMCRSVLCAYGASLLSTVGFRKHAGVVVATWVALVGVAWMSERLVADGHIASAKDAGILFAISYVGQELAHAMTREKTYQQSYMFDAGWTSTLLEHTYFLLPLCFDAAWHAKDVPVLSWIVAHNYVLRCKMTGAKEKKALRDIYDFVTNEDPARDRTAHWWFEKLRGKTKKAFENVIDSEAIANMFAKKFRSDAWAVEPIYSMNEIYVASSHHNFNSDTVFYMEHCDGPWSVYPWCFVYRCMVAVNENVQVETVFPMEGSGSCLSDGDVVGFDYHREIHIIRDLPTKNTDRRVTMKLHYVVYPRCFGFLGRFLAKLASFYNWAARNLFLSTIAPANTFWKFMAFMVLFVTRSVFELEKRAGLSSVVAVLAAYYIGNNFIHEHFFLAFTSYTHYCMYIATYQIREGINFGTFKRNVVFFKSIALFHLGYNYFIKYFQYDLISLAMILGGYSLSFSAAYALGVDQTYFGVELGECEPNFVDGFPYNLGIPHPMIIGSIVGLLGFHKNELFREHLPYLVPAHCLFYLVHMVQEHLCDIYKYDDDKSSGKNTGTKTKTSPGRKKIGSSKKDNNALVGGSAATTRRRSSRLSPNNKVDDRSPAWARD